jgi:hypothetical protein
MPVLDLPRLTSPALAAAYLVAVMYRPREPASHQEMARAVQLDALRNVIKKRRHDGREIPRYAMPAVVEAVTGPSIRETAPQNLIAPKYMIARPEVAVHLFLYVLSCAAAKDPKEPATLEHARAVIGGGRPGLGRSELIEIWRDFSPAVHLLAMRYTLKPLWDMSGASPAAITKFLALADVVRILGERHKTPKSKTPLLDPRETWTVPDWLVLPELPEDAIAFPAPSALRAIIES